MHAHARSLPPLILLIEDEETVAKLIQLMLSHEGFRVHWCKSGRDGMEAARTVTPHAIVLDLCLQDADGCKMLHELKSSPATRDIPVVIASAATHRMTPEERGLAYGIVTKPFGMAQLLGALPAAHPEAGLGALAPAPPLSEARRA